MKAVRQNCSLPDMAVPSSFQSRAVTRWEAGAGMNAIDQVAEELPVAMVYNGISHAVMLASPTGLAQFGLGFSLSEGIIADHRELYGVDVIVRDNGIEVQMTIAQQRFVELKSRRRNLAGRTGCGLCGAESLQDVVRCPAPVPTGVCISPAALHKAFGQIDGRQQLQAVTGAVHAAAWAAADGSVLYLEEDIGRHNALDKLIGTLAQAQVPVENGFALVTSRASYEMVQKAATFGIPLLAAISAPTGLAIRLAETTGLTLVGFARAGSHVIYANPQRLSN